MTRDTLRASVQYGDWTGTASADEFGDATDDFDALFEATGKVEKEKDLLIGFNLYESEGFFYLAGYFHPAVSTSDTYPALNRELKKNDEPITVKQVKVEITRDQFFKHFKRFSIVMVRSSLKDIIGRDVEYDEA